MAKKSPKKSKAAKKPAKAAKAKRSGELRDQDVERAAGGVDGSVLPPNYNVLISGLPGSGTGGSAPQESVSLNFTKITVPYKPQ
jgi:hypothetical protein